MIIIPCYLTHKKPHKERSLSEDILLVARDRVQPLHHTFRHGSLMEHYTLGQERYLGIAKPARTPCLGLLAIEKAAHLPVWHRQRSSPTVKQKTYDSGWGINLRNSFEIHILVLAQRSATIGEGKKGQHNTTRT